MGRSRTKSTAAQAFYGRWATLYDLISRYTPGVARIRRFAVDTLDLDLGDTVVEMGCGTGANLPLLAERVGRDGTVVGIDFTRPVLGRARAHTHEYENVHVVRGDATAPPIEGQVDAVLATFVVGMLDDPADAVDGWCDLVGAGGRVVLVNAARSDSRYAPVVNAAFRAVVVLSTPPTTTLRYDEDLTARLDERIRAGHDRLRQRGSAVSEGRHLFGIVRTTGGRMA